MSPWLISGSTWQIQFYNQDYPDKSGGKVGKVEAYASCPSLFGDKNTEYPGTSVFEISKLPNMSMDKIVVGKPLRPKDQTNGGFMTPEVFSGCLKQGRAKKWNGGFMYWQWNVQDGPKAAQTIMS